MNATHGMAAILNTTGSRIPSGVMVWISLTFSCDGTHYMRYNEFLVKGTAFWSGIAA
jgi:hypothetical protein